jgi:hypothetical protein
MKAELQRVIDWADKAGDGERAPMDLVSIRKAPEVIACLEATPPQMEGLPQLRTRQDVGLRLVVFNGPVTATGQ